MSRTTATVMTLALLIGGCTDSRPLATGLDAARYGHEPGSGYSRLVGSEAQEIPDGSREGVILGPVVVDDSGAMLGPVVLRLDIHHPATGDLDIWLAYDADMDGDPEVRAPVEFFHLRSQVWAGELHACPQSVHGTYYFRDGCFADDAVFLPFETLPRGGAFYLTVADTLAGDTGSVHDWAVYMEKGETSAGD